MHEIELCNVLTLSWRWNYLVVNIFSTYHSESRTEVAIPTTITRRRTRQHVEFDRLWSCASQQGMHNDNLPKDWITAFEKFLCRLSITQNKPILFSHFVEKGKNSLMFICYSICFLILLNEFIQIITYSYYVKWHQITARHLKNFLVPRLHFPARKKVTTQQEDFKNNCKPAEFSIFKMHGQEEPCRSYSINLYHCRMAKIKTIISIIQNWDTFYLGFIH